MSASNSPFTSPFGMNPSSVAGISTAGDIARSEGDSSNVLSAGELSTLKGGARRPRKRTARRRTGAKKGAKRQSSKRRSMRRRWFY